MNLRMRHLSLLALLLLTPVLGRAQAFPPISNPDFPVAALGRGTPVTIDLLENDTTPQGILVKSSVKVVVPPLHGTTSVDTTTGFVTYTPSPLFTGEDAFSYTVANDSGLVSDTSYALLEIYDSVNDHATMFKDSTLVINVVANDSVNNDFTPNPATIAIVRQPYHGTVLNAANGIVTYKPNAGFVGNDSLVYQDSALGASYLAAVATLSIRVRVPNQRPIALPDTAYTSRDSVVTFSVVRNDHDPDGSIDTASVLIVRAAMHGEAIADTAGRILYIPGFDFHGRDTVWYTVADNEGALSDTTPVYIFVGAPPKAVGASFQTRRNTPFIVHLLTLVTDTVSALDTASVRVVQAPTRATAVIDPATGFLTYTPTPNIHGRDSLTFTVKNRDGIPSNAAMLRILIDDPPVTRADTATTSRNTAIPISVLANDVDSDGTILHSSVTISTPPDSGTAVVDTSSGIVTYTPKSGFIGTDHFAYRALDNDSVASLSAVVTVRVIYSPPPIAVNDLVVSLGENTTGRIDVLANDTAMTGSLRFRSLTVTRPASHGTALADTAGGVIIYTPALNYLGPDTVGYTVQNDSNLTSNRALVTLTVRAEVNDRTTIFRDSSATVSVIANDSVSGLYIPAPSTLTVQTPPAHGSVTNINTTTGSIRYQPAPLFVGADSLVYRVRNASGVTVAIASLFITIRPAYRSPIVLNDTKTLRQNTTVLIGVLANDSDPNGDSIHVLSVTKPPHGTAAVMHDSIQYTPDMNYLGPDSCQYVVGDPFGAHVAASVLLTVISLSYDITDLGTLGGTVSRAYGINDAGTVVGASLTASDQVQAFRWTSGTLVPLASPDTGATQAFAISQNGWIVGARVRQTTIDPVVWRNDTLTSLGSLGASPGIAYGVNASGTIVGSSTSGQLLKAFVWQSGVMTPLEASARSSQAFAINAAGIIAGYAESLPQHPHVARGTVAGGWTLVGTDSAMTRAYAVSDSGALAGSRQADTLVTAVIWNPAGQAALLAPVAGTFSEAYSINLAGIAVGVSGTIPFSDGSSPSVVPDIHRFGTANDFRALLRMQTTTYRKAAGQENLRAAIWVSGASIDLNDVIPATGGWTLLEARSINAGSQIVGTGTHNGAARAFLLTPSQSPPPVVSHLEVGTVENNAVTFNILAGAHDPRGGVLRLVSVSGGKIGTARFTADGHVTYTPFDHAIGRDTLTYAVMNGPGAMARGSVVVSVVTPPSAYALEQNYPNPFNPSTTITYALPRSGHITLAVYDLLGKRVRTLVDESQDIGVHKIVFDGHGLASGVYFCNLRAGTFSATRRLLLLK